MTCSISGGRRRVINSTHDVSRIPFPRSDRRRRTLLRVLLAGVARWCNGKAFGLAISRSRVQILLEATLRNNRRQVVYTYVPLSSSGITWYRPKGGDALRLGR